MERVRKEERAVEGERKRDTLAERVVEIDREKERDMEMNR